MNREDIIRMAREAGMFKLFGDPNAPEALTGASIERFFHMAQAAEREACIEDIMWHVSRSGKNTPEYERAMKIIDRIRARQ